MEQTAHTAGIMGTGQPSRGTVPRAGARTHEQLPGRIRGRNTAYNEPQRAEKGAEMTSWDQEVTRLQAALEDSEGKRHAAEIAVSTMYTDMNGLRQQLKKSIDREMDLDRLLQDAREENARLKGQLKNKYLCTSDDVSDEDLAEAEALPYWYRVAADAQAEINRMKACEAIVENLDMALRATNPYYKGEAWSKYKAGCAKSDG